MGRTVESGSKTQMSLGTTVSYISPPLIHARLSRRIKESKRHSLSKEFDGWILDGSRDPLMRSQKARYIWLFGSIVIIT